MKRKDVSKLHSNTDKELEVKLEELQKSLVLEGMGIKLGSQKNTSLSSSIRRDIARVKTILHSRKLEAAAKSKEKEADKDIKKGK